LIQLNSCFKISNPRPQKTLKTRKSFLKSPGSRGPYNSNFKLEKTILPDYTGWTKINVHEKQKLRLFSQCKKFEQQGIKRIFVCSVYRFLTNLYLPTVEMSERNREAMQIPSPTFCHCSVVVVLINSVLQFCSALFG
jgi:hypothetical protein